MGLWPRPPADKHTMLALLVLAAVASLLPPQTSPSPCGLSLKVLLTRRTATLRELRCWLVRGKSLSHQPLRSLCLRPQAPTSASSSPPLSPRSGSLAQGSPTTPRAAPRDAASTPLGTARGSRRLRPRWRRTCPSCKHHPRLYWCHLRTFQRA